VVQNDDECEVQSRVAIDAVAGTVYHIAVDGFNGSTGAISLSIQQ
jgi:hypothetical protein